MHTHTSWHCMRACMVCYKIGCLGFVTDGEFGSLRQYGRTRPLTIFQIRNTIKNKYLKKKSKALLDHITSEVES